MKYKIKTTSFNFIRPKRFSESTFITKIAFNYKTIIEVDFHNRASTVIKIGKTSIPSFKIKKKTPSSNRIENPCVTFVINFD